MIRSWLVLFVLSFVFVVKEYVAAHAADKPPSFVDDIRPLLDRKCISCHGADKQEGGLRLDSAEAAKRGGDRGPSIVPGSVEKSLLAKAITFADPDLQMPPRQKMSDQEVGLFLDWIKLGAEWPESPVVLFEDEPSFLAALKNGNGRTRIVDSEAFQGRIAFGVTPLQRDSPTIPNWRYDIRENPQAGQYRFLRFAWKKRGEGSVMIELATSGRWPDAKSPKGRYVAGPNTTGWAAVSVADVAPADWTVVTVDLWKDLGDVTVTGIAPTCDRGEEACFDSMILAPSIGSLDAYRPKKSNENESTSDVSPLELGDAFSDERNPIRKLFRGERLNHWSWKHPQRTAEFSELAASLRTLPDELLIDAAIEERLKRERIDSSPEADPRTLIRRLSFDLTGLPPSPEEVDRFVSESTAQSTSTRSTKQPTDAYDRLVDRLLASPRYGERQARLWLDVVRYADTNGYERDEFRPLMWQYRDYVIRSMNADKPFDQFIREQIAGDEISSLPPKNEAEADMLIATGFLRLGQWDSTAAIFQEEKRLRAETMADLTNTTSAAFLGQTFSCCQCHDHKYDPFSQADHFRFRAFFAGVTARDDLPISLAEEQLAIDRHNAECDKRVAPLKSERDKLDKKDKANEARLAELTKAITEIEATRRQPRRAMGATDGGATAPVTQVFYQGDFSSPCEEVQPGFPGLFAPGPAKVHAPREGTTGRRLALANWIASPQNPWTARVIVNRIWQQHFGFGLVATSNDFGFSGSPPTHPELLDELSLRFTQHKWSIKQLHRMIVRSATYRQSSRRVRDSSTHPDPDNKLLWRQNVRRLDAETIRDSLLVVSNLLKNSDGGKPVWPTVPDELLHAQPAILEAEKGGDGGRMQGWYPDPIENTDVRSLFLIRKRCLPIPFLQAFDLPDTTVSCARRDTTVVAPQALMLLNSPDGLRYAGAFAERLLSARKAFRITVPSEVETLVDDAFRIAIHRRPDRDELRLSSDFLRQHHQIHSTNHSQSEADKRAVTDLCRALINLNEFAYVD